VLQRALAKAPADRFPTAHAFAEALSTGAVLARRPLRGWRRVGAVVATIVVLALAAKGLSSILTETGIDKLAVLPLTDLTNDPEQTYLAEGVHEALIAELEQLGLSVTARATMAQFRNSDKPIREIEIAAKLTHPNILGLHDCGEADGQLYYTMPFVEGESLRDRLNREKQLSIDDALEITKEVADALGHAHSLGIVHRDIKPENILFTAGHAVVSDFGIARAVTEAGAATLTETGLAVGTPLRASSEHAYPDAEREVRHVVRPRAGGQARVRPAWNPCRAQAAHHLRHGPYPAQDRVHQGDHGMAGQVLGAGGEVAPRPHP